MDHFRLNCRRYSQALDARAGSGRLYYHDAAGHCRRHRWWVCRTVVEDRWPIRTTRRSGFSRSPRVCRAWRNNYSRRLSRNCRSPCISQHSANLPSCYQLGLIFSLRAKGPSTLEWWTFFATLVQPPKICHENVENRCCFCLTPHKIYV